MDAVYRAGLGMVFYTTKVFYRRFVIVKIESDL